MVKKIIALGMNSFQRKQVHEFQAIVKMGYSVDIFTNDTTKSSDIEAKKINGPVKHIALEKGFFKRLIQIIRHLSNKRSAVVANIYPGGRFAWIYLLLCKFNKINTVCVEWGNLVDWGRLDWVTKFSLIVCYRYCDAVWYKEPYMEAKIKRFGGRNLFFIHNCSANSRNFHKRENTHGQIFTQRCPTGEHPGKFRRRRDI